MKLCVKNCKFLGLASYVYNFLCEVRFQPKLILIFDGAFLKKGKTHCIYAYVFYHEID